VRSSSLSPWGYQPAVGPTSIRRNRPGSADNQAWPTFLANHLKGIWAADLLVVQTSNYRVIYVFFIVSHERRELMHFQCHLQSDRGVDVAPAAGGNSMGPAVDTPDP
jgi:hypothetical protein